MTQVKIIQRGAEAVLYISENKDGKVLVKERIKKGYRIQELDKKIRTQRTKREENLLLKAKRAGISVPTIWDTDNFKIIMDFIPGKTVKNTLNILPKNQRLEIYKLIGEAIGKMHNSGIIHGDLTTSNMIVSTEPFLREASVSSKGYSLPQNMKLYFIDFGLGKQSKKIEDQAVDLYLLYEALKAAHFKYMNDAWTNILKYYKQKYLHADKVIKRLDKIAKRRRYIGG